MMLHTPQDRRSRCYAAGLCLALWLVSSSLDAQDQAQAYAFAETDAAATTKLLQQRAALRFRMVGNTSIVMQVLLEGGGKAAFKPLAKPRASGWESELAAYRLAQALGLDNVPVVTLRRIRRETLKTRFVQGGRSSWARSAEAIHWLNDGQQAVGAMIHWVDELEDVALGRSEEREAAFAGLRQGEAFDSAQSVRLRDYANMLLLDYLIGNWDRFSGGNTKAHGPSGRLCIRDHDVAFANPLPERLHSRVLGRLQEAERFDPEVITRLVALDAATLARIVNPEPESRARLSEAQLAALTERRLTALSYISALVDAYGEAAVLSLSLGGRP